MGKEQSIRIGYLGDGPWAHKALALLNKDPHVEVAFVVPRYDLQDPVLREMSQEYGIPFWLVSDVNDSDFLSKVQSLSCQLLVSMSFDQIFRKPALALENCKVINCHAGRLPFYRGRNILNWALINDEKEFGITVHLVDEGIDTGDIILQKVFPVTDQDDYSTLLQRAHGECAAILHEAISEIRLETAKYTKQSSIHSTGMYCGRRGRGDEVLDWNQTSREIFNFVRAICKPGPQARTYCNDSEIIINKVSLVPHAPIYKGKPGQVLCKVSDQPTFWVKTLDSFIEVVEYTGKLRVGVTLEPTSRC